MVPLRDHGKYLALLSIVWAIGSVMGPIIGGALSQHGQWRWIFWINLPIVGVGFIGIFFFLKLHYRNRAVDVKLAEIEYVGSFLFTASATSFLIPITLGSVMYPWSSWHTLVPLSLGVAGLLAFCLYEAKFASVTLLPLRLFKNRTITISYFGTFIHAAIDGLVGSEDLYSLDVVALVTTIKQLPTEAMQTFQLKTALAHSLRILWAVMFELAALATVASFFVEGYDLDQVHLTEQGFMGGKSDAALAQVADQKEKTGSIKNPI
ncbi:MAG: hypothetical protein Q9178_000462 [Gyalolechia marmorata]